MKGSEVNDYETFLRSKQVIAPSIGIEVSERELSSILFPFQKAMVRWALAHGRAALFADTGLGKTPMQIEWAQQLHECTRGRYLAIAPLAVARQTVEEGKKFGYEIAYVRTPAEARTPLTITNYEMIEHFNPADYDGVVLDESSILKSLASKTRQQLTEMFRHTRFRLCCTATPAPNDIAEIANHAEFLGVMTRNEMMAAFFVNCEARAGGNSDRWRLKRHAGQGPFWQWMASWAMSVKKPSDLGFSDEGYDLPPLTVTPHFLDCDAAPSDRLFAVDVRGVGEAAALRHATKSARVAAVRELVLGEPDQQYLIWCDYNDEDDALCAAIPGAVSVKGSDSPEQKADALLAFAHGNIQRLVTKPSIAAFGLNFQTCARTAFCGLSFSWEAYYQAIRRFWRFGQQNPVNVHVVLSQPERPVWEAIQRKERDAERMSRELIRHVASFERAELQHISNRQEYEPQKRLRLPAWVKGYAA